MKVEEMWEKKEAQKLKRQREIMAGPSNEELAKMETARESMAGAWTTITNSRAELHRCKAAEREARREQHLAETSARLLANHRVATHGALINRLRADPYADPSRFPKLFKLRQARRRAARAIRQKKTLKEETESGSSSDERDDNL